MRAIDFPESNITFGKPESMTDEECYPVSAYMGGTGAGETPYINTVCQPNKEDIEAIIAGRPIILSITGYSMPPVSLFTCDENGKPNE